MAQFKRVISQDGLPGDKIGSDEKDTFFEESFDLDFLEDTAPVTTQPLQSEPISLSIPSTPTPTQNDANEDDWEDLAHAINPVPEAQAPESWDMDLGLADKADLSTFGGISPPPSAVAPAS